MKVIVIVNGSLDWSPWFPGHDVRQVHLQNSRWLVQDGRLWIVNKAGTHRPDGILWRLGAVKPDPMHRACLEMIRLTGTPCVNPASALLRGYDRLGMLTELKLAGLPVIPFDVAAGEASLDVQVPQLPTVLKLDNYHGGQAKGLAHTEEQWRDLVSLTSPYMGYATTEPFIAYERDVRCLIVGNQFWSMERRSSGWKANVGTTEFQMIAPDSQLIEWTRKAAEHLGADVLGLDYLQDAQGNYTLLESNDIPGVRGFPEEVRKVMALILMERVRNAVSIQSAEHHNKRTGIAARSSAMHRADGGRVSSVQICTMKFRRLVAKSENWPPRAAA